LKNGFETVADLRRIILALLGAGCEAAREHHDGNQSQCKNTSHVGPYDVKSTARSGMTVPAFPSDDAERLRGDYAWSEK
jgi:hypothetical protein